MPNVEKYDHGVPSWVDLGTPDLPGGLRFYSELFGWEGQDMGEETGHYNLMSKDGKMVAGIGPAQDPGPPRWTSYVNVDDADAAIKLAEEAGGTVIVAPMDVMTAGRMGMFADTTGAVIAVWQPGDHKGAQLVNDPGTLTWNELSTSDLAKSKAFYSAVFGWEWGGSDQYSEAKVNGRTIAGVQLRPAGMPESAPDMWLVYFGSADVERDVSRVTALGGTVLVEPVEVPGMGRFAVLSDPQGASFALFQG